MEIIYKNVSDLRPDQSQPRKYTNNKKIDEIAISIKNEGIINPIEIDNNNIIITGERRWRGAIKAGLKQIPCKILNIDANKRFIRQIQENIHHNTLNTIEIGEGLLKTIKILKKQNPEKEVTYKELSELYGKSTFWIYEHLKLLKEPEDIKIALSKGITNRGKVREKNKIPKEFRKEFENKIITKQKHIPFVGIKAIADGVRRAYAFNDKKAIKSLLSDSYKDKDNQVLSTREIVQKVREISPDIASIMDSDIERTKLITRKITELEKTLKENPLSSLKDIFSKQSLMFQLRTLSFITQKYLQKKDITKKIKEANTNKNKLLNHENK